MYDIAIIGAGPAGATLGRLLGGRYKVLMLDRRPLDIERPCVPAGEISVAGELGPTKCCGGLLAPDAQKMLACLGLALPDHVLGGEQLFAVRAIDLPGGVERFYQRHYINIDREQFDRWLVGLLPPKVDLRCQCRVQSLRRDGDSHEIAFDCGGQTHTEHAKIVVGADGANSFVRRELEKGTEKRGLSTFPVSNVDDAQLAARSTAPLLTANCGMEKLNVPFFAPTHYVAIQEWYELATAMPYYGAIFDEEVTDYYSWTIPKGEFLLVGSALAPGQACAAKFELLKHKLSRIGLRLGRRVRREGCLLLRPRRLGDICLGQGNVALIGEASGWISPSSGEGISYALASAQALAESLETGMEDFAARYRRRTRGLRMNIAGKLVKRRLIYNGTLRRAAMRVGIGGLDIVCSAPAGTSRKRGHSTFPIPD